MNLKKKNVFHLLWGVGISIALILTFSGILFFQKNLIVPKVQASPGPECKVEDDLKVTKSLTVSDFTKTKLVAQEYWNFPSWNTAGEIANFTLNTTYSYALVAVQIDAQTDWGGITFYDGANGTGAAVASAQWKVTRYDWKQGQMLFVLVPTNAKSVKIIERGAFGGEQDNINMVVITYVP